MKSRSRPSLFLIVITVALLCPALLARSSASAVVKNRTVKRLSRPGEPVQIVAVRVKGKTVAFGKAFAGKNDWLGGLGIVIKNTSEKSISWVKVALSFHKDRAPDVRLVDYVTYGIGRGDIEKMRGGGPPLKPGEMAEVFYPLEQYQSIREILDGMGYPQSIAQIRVSAEQVSFEGEPDVMWIEGKMNAMDTRSPSGWSPIKP